MLRGEAPKPNLMYLRIFLAPSPLSSPPHYSLESIGTCVRGGEEIFTPADRYGLQPQSEMHLFPFRNSDSCILLHVQTGNIGNGINRRAWVTH